MKKSNIVIISVCALILLLSGIFALRYIKTQKSGPSAVNGDFTESAQKQRAKKLPTAVRAVEDEDFSLSGGFAEQNEAGEDSLAFLSSSCFDSVFVKTKAFSASKSGSLSAKKQKALKSFLKKLKKQGKSIYLEVDISKKDSDFKKAFSFDVDGIILTGTKEKSAADICKRFEKAALSKGKKSVALELDSSFAEEEKLAFKKDKPLFFLLALSEKSEEESKAALEKFQPLCERTEVGLCAAVRLADSKKADASLALKNTRLADSFSFVSSRLFCSLSKAQSDLGKCFSAVREYLENGIDSSLAFSPLSIDGYTEGSAVQTSEHKASLTLRGSYLYPVYFENEELETSKDGKITLDLALKNGKNEFVFSQCAKKLTYLVNVNFEDELIQKIEPGAALYVSEGRKIKVTVTAVSGASVTVRAGALRFEAEKTTKEKDGCCEYTATVTAPNSKVEIDSIGRLSVVASYNGETFTKEGPAVIYAGNTGEVSAKPDNTEKVTIGNNVSNNEDGQTSAVSNPTPFRQYTGNQMCVVTADYADTWPPQTDDDSFVPYYTPLVKGTIDYVTGQSQVYDSEEDITRDFFSLASGRRVQTKDVMLVSYANQGENRISVASSEIKNGDLEIRLNMNWEVPYSFSFGPQSYYSAYSKKFNVSSFTAQYIRFTFYYTSSAGGAIDTSQSPVVSSAGWSADSSQTAVNLTFALRKEGAYYGYSITRNSSGQLVLTIKGKPKTLSNTLVVLDPGHGGSDGGAEGLSGAVNESVLNLALAAAAKNELEKRGARVLLTRTDNSDITLEQRKAYARNQNADLFVSIHCNASVNTSKLGTAVYYYRPFSKPLAGAIYEKMLALFRNDFYAAEPSKRSDCAVGTIYNPFSVTRLEECPSVLVETAFITNENECRLLLDSSNRDKIAAAIADGIESYLAQ